MSSLAGVRVERSDGTTVRLADVAEGPVVIQVLRYYGWLPCRDYLAQLSEARPAIESAGASLLAVGGRSHDQARSLEATGLGITLLVDPRGELRRAIGLGRLSAWGLLGPVGAWRYLRGLRRARPGRISVGNATDRPGVVVADGNLVPRWVHRGATLGDYPPIDRVVAEVAALAT